ncbi:hypothetical protein P154DRAFT_621828 [Amniculicola lignicola CBS 123094]|uniref:Uncharacterized protein n=1 Tax=Amniculicola lignicola CBS 123094 TaxID=1392246 RepID=A0A6A5W8J8_9PLEO|nr:hypothetical protein P154DRAFT_621828 [Amniculicola lignicola CBS 123094]
MPQEGYEMRSKFQETEMSPTSLKTPNTFTAANVQEMVPGSPHSWSTPVRDRVTTTTLRLNLWPAVIFIVYAVSTLFPWILLCILSKRPIRGPPQFTSWESPEGFDLEHWYEVSRQYYTVARILHMIGAVLTIPITSAICSVAVIVYIQSGSGRTELNMSQLVALADQGWANPRSWTGLKQNGSRPLQIAITLTLTGCVFQVLQAVCVQPETIKVPSYNSGSATVGGYVFVRDLPIQRYNDQGILVHQLRSTMNAATLYDSPNNVWFGSVKRGESDQGRLGDLPAGFTTGVMHEPQYAPRIDSDTSAVDIDEKEFQANCRDETSSGGLYVKYERTYNETSYSTFGAVACMPGDQSKTHWRPTRDQQNLTESLYLNISSSILILGEVETRYIKVTTFSTLGYFEIPSYRNGNVAGPIIAKDPFDFTTNPHSLQLLPKRAAKAEFVSEAQNTGNLSLIGTPNKGPLLSVALALFGNGSYIATHLQHPEAYQQSEPRPDSPRNQTLCADLAPLRLMNDGGCVINGEQLADVGTQIGEWLSATFKRELPTALLDSGVTLANRLWLGGAGVTTKLPTRGWISIQYNKGINMMKPKMALWQIIVGSIFLGTHLLGLLILTVYSVYRRAWVSYLGAEAMLRIGASYADELSRIGHKLCYSDQLDGVPFTNPWKDKLDSLPGFIGDAKAGKGIGRLEMGAQFGLSPAKGKEFEVL